MATAKLNGTTIWYEVDGEGPPCLVLHGGLGLDHSLYRAAFSPLAERVQLVFFDHRGNGRSGRPSLDTITIEQLADDAAALAAHLGHRRVIVVGHSYGGFVGQELALRHPDLVAALVLVDTTPGQLGVTEHADDDQGPPPPPEVVEALAVVPSTDQELAEGTTRLLPYYLHRRDPAEIEPLLSDVVFDAAAMIRGFVVLAAWSSVDRLPTLTAPTLVLVGRHDVFTSPPQARRIASRISDAELVVFDDSGHMPWLDEPESFFDTVKRWLDRRAAADARPARPRATTSDDALGVVSAFGVACNAHDLEMALGLCADDIVFESTTPPDGERVVGHAGLRAVWTLIFENAATHVDVEDTIVAGDRVVQRCLYSWSDGHVRAVDLYRVRDGKIVEKLSYVKG